MGCSPYFRMPWLQSSKAISNGIHAKPNQTWKNTAFHSPKRPPSSRIQLPSTLMTAPALTGWSLLGLRCEIVCSTLSMSSEDDAIASSAHDKPLVLSETFTNPESIHESVS
jgi:hypothetical protein